LVLQATRETGLRPHSRLQHSQPGPGALLQAAVDPLVSIATLAGVVSLFGGRFDGACLILALLVFAMTFPGSFARTGDDGMRGSAGELMLDIVTGWLAIVALLLLLGWASRTLGVFDQRVLLAWAIGTPAALFAAHRLLSRVLPRLLAAEGLRKTAVIAGANDLGRGLAARLRANPVHGVRFAGYFDDRALNRINELHASKGFRVVSGEGGGPFGLERYSKAFFVAWYYQHVVDHWDFDHPFERLLVDTAVAPARDQVTWINPRIRPGERRKVVTGIPGKTGIVYTLDRQTGEFLWARPTVRQNVVANIDGATGKVTVNPDVTFSAIGQEKFVCPTINGGKNFQAGAYSPLTNTMYYPLQNACFDVTPVPDTPTQIYAISTKPKLAPGTEKLGTVEAINVETGKTVWKYEQRAGTMSLVATGGGLLFGGDTNGHFRAFDQENGKVLWDVNLGSPVTGYPITYSVGGKQYVAVSVGNSLVSTGLIRLTPELKPSNSSNVFVFAVE